MLVRKQRFRTVLYFYILLVLLILLVTASYTWMTISRHLRVSDVALYVTSGTGLELAADYRAPDEAWSEVLDFQSIVGGDTALAPATWSERNQELYTVRYGYDGRTIDGSYRRLTEAENANRNDIEAYYLTGRFYMRTGDACTVSLGEGVAVNGGRNGSGTYVIGTPLWNAQTIAHDSGGSGAERAIRVRIEIVLVDPNTGEPIGVPVSYLYEPNCDVHVDSGISGYVDTPSIDGGDTLVSRDRLILQTASQWEEAYPVEQNVTIKDFGQFLTDTQLISLGEGEMARVQVSVWLEGMDADCTNEIRDAQITINIQFATDLGGHGGLVEIED